MTALSAAGRRLEGLGLVILSGCSFATLGIFNRFAAARGVNVPTLLTLRFLLASACLWALLLPRHPARVPLRRAGGFLVMGLLFVLEALLFFVSSRLIPVALTVLLLYLFPAWVLLLGWALKGERPRPRSLLALALALMGIALAVGSPARRPDSAGLAMGLLGSLVYAVYILLGARLQKGFPPLVSATWITTWAALAFLLLGAGSGSLHPARALGAWGPILSLALLGTVVPVFSLMAGLARIAPTQASIASTVEPIAAAIMAALFLHEGLGRLQVAGGILVLAAVLMLALDSAPGTRARDSEA